jgi:hypothetical protein
MPLTFSNEPDDPINPDYIMEDASDEEQVDFEAAMEDAEDENEGRGLCPVGLGV